MKIRTRLLLLLPLLLMIGCSSSDDDSDSSGLMLDDGTDSQTSGAEGSEVPNDLDVPADDTEATVGNGLEGGLLQETPEPVRSNTSAIAGFWDFSLEDGSDVVYQEITNEGRIVSYDYDQDPAGEGQNCYYIQEDSITALGDDQYEFGDTQITLQTGNGSLFASGSEGEGEVIVIPPVVGIDPIDLNPCEGTIF